MEVADFPLIAEPTLSLELLQTVDTYFALRAAKDIAALGRLLGPGIALHPSGNVDGLHERHSMSILATEGAAARVGEPISSGVLRGGDAAFLLCRARVERTGSDGLLHEDESVFTFVLERAGATADGTLPPWLIVQICRCKGSSETAERHAAARPAGSQLIDCGERTCEAPKEALDAIAQALAVASYSTDPAERARFWAPGENVIMRPSGNPLTAEQHLLLLRAQDA